MKFNYLFFIHPVYVIDCKRRSLFTESVPGTVGVLRRQSPPKDGKYKDNVNRLDRINVVTLIAWFSFMTPNYLIIYTGQNNNSIY
jgi:hypothetical protein